MEITPDVTKKYIIFTIERPNGQIEDVLNEKLKFFNDDSWVNAKEAYKKRPEAGKLLQVLLVEFENEDKMKINPEWDHFQGINENASGFNPHEKYIWIKREVVRKEKVWRD